VQVAVKCLAPSVLASSSKSAVPGGHSQAVSDFLTEASVLASLRHPNVVNCYGVVLPAHQGDSVYEQSDATDFDSSACAQPAGIEGPSLGSAAAHIGPAGKETE
jgi:serine/threonine protein kinase